MSRPERIAVQVADSRQIILLEWQIIQVGAAGRLFPIVEYRVAETPARSARTVLCLAGGGSSGVLFAPVAQLCAAQGIELVMFDLPGHTRPGLLGNKGPDPGLLGLVDPPTRRALVDAMVARWIWLSGLERIEIAAHSAGFLDASRIDRSHTDSIDRFFILGAGIPGLGAMLGAYRAAARARSAERLSLGEIRRTQVAPTGAPAIHFGPSERRLVADALLERYQGSEHAAVVLQLMRRKSFGTELWDGAEVELIASAGDRIVSPAAMARARRTLERLGASARLHRLEADLPHMFMMFEKGAAFTANVIAAAPGARGRA